MEMVCQQQQQQVPVIGGIALATCALVTCHLQVQCRRQCVLSQAFNHESLCRFNAGVYAIAADPTAGFLADVPLNMSRRQ
jgi:hypothetical protein